MLIAHDIPTVRAFRKASPGRLALVPTMGALHAGHLAHVAQLREVADRVVVSIFVNPMQFGPGEDFARYPRPVEDDMRLCRDAGAHCVFLPSDEVMYPPDIPDVTLDVPNLSGVLEGASRPGHFAGVCRVVAKLLNIVQPDVVSLGQKDYQQLRVVEAMIKDLLLPVQILEVPTLREPDGLAMSSRNRYLSDEQRRHALGLFKALQQARTLIEEDGETDPAAVESAMTEIIAAHQLTLDYAVVRHPTTLTPLDALDPTLTGGVVALVAARIDSVRLIDNLLLGR